jgi:hypothetical protein
MSESALTKKTIGEVLTPDEIQFVKTLPNERWILCKKSIKNLSSMLEGFEVKDLFVTVIAVGPEVRADIKPGDQINYAEGLDLPKELKDVPWTRKYAWVHENKFLGRLPRNEDETQLKMLKPPSGDDTDVFVRLIADKARKAVQDIQTKMGKNG